MLDVGDVLVFVARMLHATIPNPTGETRVVVSFRVAPGRLLRYSRNGSNFHPYTDVRLAGHAVRARGHPAVVRHRRGRAELVDPAPAATATCVTS